nr:uncharacterized protein LOC106614091 isoform X5 [Bactrocera oleae]
MYGHIFSSITVNTSNCNPTGADTACNTELSDQIGHKGSKLNIDTEGRKSSCSPALLDFSFDSGIGMGASSFTDNVSVVDGKLTSKTENNKTLQSANDIPSTDIESVHGNDAVDFHGKLASFISIGTGISNNSKEQMCWKLRYERLQQCRLILFALNRQQSQYRQLRERLSKIGEGRITKKEAVVDNICNVCSCPINIIDPKSFITCFVCNKRICHATKCSNLVPKSGQRECQICHSSKDSLTHTQSWIAEQMFFNHQKYVYPMRARSEIYIPIKDYNEGSTYFESVSQVGANSFVITPDQKTKIREYVAEMVAKLLGSSQDQIRITQLTNSENYLPGILNNHVVHQHPVGLNDNQTNEDTLTEFSEISQRRLRHMIESIISEMLRTPCLANVNVSEPELNSNIYGNGRTQPCHRHRTEHYFEPKAYHDFLATEVLNKIADKEEYIRKLSESTPDLSSCNADINFNMNDRSTSSDSSLKTTSPSHYTDTQHSSKIIKDLDRELTINDYIASHTVPLPDLSAAMAEYKEDDMASVSSSILGEGNWEDNWLFRKKRSSVTTSITGSIGMLVPAPKDDVRAQIGDKTTDEISDLSEIDSDTDDSIKSGLDPFNDRILNKHLIGGQNTKVILDELIETASLVSNISRSPNEANCIETINEHIVEKAPKTEAFNSRVTNHLPHSTQESENNPLSAQLQATESIEVDESCTGFSSVEIFEETVLSHDTRSICQETSVIEILAAITLAPLLAVPSSEQPSIQTPFEMNALKELSDLALAEIKSRIPELSHHSLDIIDEEEETKIMNSLEINESCSEKCVPLSDIKEIMNSSLIPNSITNLVDEKDLHKLSTKICAETPSPEITELLLSSSSERIFKDSNRSNIILLPELKIFSIDESSYVKILCSESESELSSKTTIRCSSHEEPSESIHPLEKVIPKICTKAIINDVIYTKGALSTETSHSFEIEKQAPYNETGYERNRESNQASKTESEKLEYKCGADVYDKIGNLGNHRPLQLETAAIAPTLKSEKQKPCIQAEQCVMDIESENRIPFFEKSETEKRQLIRQSKEKGTNNRRSENLKLFSDQIEDCDNEKKESKSWLTPYTSETEKQQHICESQGDGIMNTTDATENESKNSFNDTAGECVCVGTKSENRIIFSEQKPESAIEKSASKIPYIFVTEKQTPIDATKGDNILKTKPVESVATDNKKHETCNKPEKECVIDKQSVNEIPYIEQTDGRDNEAEYREFSQTPYSTVPNKKQPISESLTDCIMNKEAAESSEKENENQKSCNEREEVHGMDQNRENQITSEMRYTYKPGKQELISDPTGECIMDTEAVESSVTDIGKQNPFTEPEEESVIDIECENRSPFTDQEEKCAIEKEVSESPQTSYACVTKKQQSDYESQEVKIMDTETHQEEKCAIEKEVSGSSQNDERDNKAETQESSEIPYIPVPAKQEPISESKEESIMDIEAVELSVTDNGKQNPFTEPEVESVIDTECEKRSPFTDQEGKCAIEKEISESSQTSHISVTEKKQSDCSIAEREYKKWSNAVEMPNNPYTPDALKRRISGSQERFIDLPNISSSTNKSVITVKAEDDVENESTSNIGYKRYSRDYYINTDNPPKASPNHQIHRNDKRKRLSSGCSDELIEDSFTKESISQGNETTAKENRIVIHPTVCLALPAQVGEETLSNQSMISVNTTTSDDSDTICIYNFKNQSAAIVHNENKPLTTDTTDTTVTTTSNSVEPFPATTKCVFTKDALAKSKKSDEYEVLCPRELLLETKATETCVSTLAPGPTPKAFKFLQPKRRLIDPSQVLPLDEEVHGLSFGEKAVVEKEVAQVMPSVKALAQAFLLSSNKCSQAEKRWKKGIQKMPSTAIKLNQPPTAHTENMVTAPEMTEDATIASDLSSLDTDPSINMGSLSNKTKTSSLERTVNYEDNNNKNTSNMLRRVSMLKSNIAFFENLKFK